MPAQPAKSFTLRDRLGSVVHALAGIALVLRTQHNAWIHTAATAMVVVAGLLLEIDIAGWCWLTVAIALVWVTETLNTAVEILCNLTSPTFHPLVKQAKDVAAGAVLIASLCAGIIGLLVLGPPLLRLLA